MQPPRGEDKDRKVEAEAGGDGPALRPKQQTEKEADRQPILGPVAAALKPKTPLEDRSRHPCPANASADCGSASLQRRVERPSFLRRPTAVAHALHAHGDQPSAQ